MGNRFGLLTLGICVASSLLGVLPEGRGPFAPALAAEAKSPAESKSLELDRIEITGVSIFERPEIEASLELTAGDKLVRQKVVRTAENLQKLYHDHGYEEVRVRSELLRQKVPEGGSETVLKFVVEEGRPTRIAEIRLTQRKDSLRDYWENNEPAIRGRVGFAPGAVLEQEKVSAGKRAIQDALASEEFIGARVEDVRVTTTEAPTQTTGGTSAEAARWVSVEFRVDLGDRVTFGFRGNTVFTKSKLLSLIEDQRVIGFGQDYVGSIRGRIAEEYRSLGYARAQIEAKTFEKKEQLERHVTFFITEGPRVQIDGVEFDGNLVYTNAQLRQVFFERATYLVQLRHYVEKEVEKSAEILIEWIKSQGYLAAKLVTISRTYDQKGDKANLVVYLYEGDRTLVESIKVQGAGALPREEILRILGVKERSPINLFAFSEGLENLKIAYRRKGYLDMRIENESSETVVQYAQENRAAEISLDIVEGPQYRVSKIELEGLTETREEVVWRELAFKKEDVLNEDNISESEARLRKLGIFSSVAVRFTDDPERPGFKSVRVTLQEGSPGIIAGGLGYRNDLGPRVFGQVAYTNLWQRNHTVSLNGDLHRRFDENFCATREQRQNEPNVDHCFPEYQFQLSYLWPFFTKNQVNFRPRFTVERMQYKTFDVSSIALGLTWEKRLLVKTNLVGSLTYSLERPVIFNSNNALEFDPTRYTGNESLRIGTIGPSLRLDLRDNPLAPTRGFFASTSFEYASPYLLSQAEPFPVAFTRFQWRSDGFVPVARGTSLYLSFRTGLARNLAAPENEDPNNPDPRYAIPRYKLFTMGGAGSLRGFQEQELSVDTSTIVRGTLSYVNYRAQLDLPFSGNLRFGPFLDAANLLVDRFSFADGLRYGGGVGFHYQSPLGPVNFDLGFKLNRRPEEGLYRFYFSIGVI